MPFVFTVKQTSMSDLQGAVDPRVICGDVTHDTKGKVMVDLVLGSGNTGMSIGKGQEMEKDAYKCILICKTRAGQTNKGEFPLKTEGILTNQTVYVHSVKG